MDIRIFENEMFGSIRSVFVESRNEFMFNGRDVCGILEYKDPYNILKRNVETVDKMKIRIQTAGGPQSATFISIQGVYDLCIHSTMPRAKDFQRWITHEVLMDIRNYGLYVGDNAPSVQVQRDAQGRRIAIDFDTNALLGQLEQLKRDIVRVNNKCDILQQDNLYLRRILANEANMYGLSEDDFEFVFQTDRSKYPYMP